MNNVINLVNFVRGCEPRDPKLDLYLPVVGEMAINKEFGLKSTFLLQYDAMLRDDFKELFLKEQNESLELGVWLEMGRPLVEAVGLPWRGREGYDWDWHVNSGFLEGYTPNERKLIIDEVFRLFKEIFGYYPKVAGSWLIDAFSLSYMSDTYGMDAYCCCREQYAVDAYTLWGGYYNGGYYPSRNNMLCPAQCDENQIPTPMFRMLGLDPIYAHPIPGATPKFGGCFTLEPAWASGRDTETVKWYFRSYFENPSLAGSHLTTGQENSFGWHKIQEGYRVQAKLIREYVDAGKLKLEFLGETGVNFKNKFKKTPASVLSAFEDWSNNGTKSIWYSCKNYRAGLLQHGDKLYFRDIQKFDDRIKEEYLEKACECWQAFYFNLPIVENYLWSKDGKVSALSFEKAVASIEFSKELSENAIEYKVNFADGTSGNVTFSENGFTVADCGKLYFSCGCKKDNCKAENGILSFDYNNSKYSVRFNAAVEAYTDGFAFIPVYNTVSFDFI